MPTLEDIIKPELRSKLRTKTIPNFLSKLDANKKYQADIWDSKTYIVNPNTHVFTTIQEHFGNRLIHSLTLPNNAVVVDIGCFIGEKLWQLPQDKPYLGIGVDIAISSLVAAKKIDTHDHKFIAADLESLPFKDNSVDLVLIFDVIEHISDPKRGFAEISRIIKPGGQLLLHIPIKDNRGSLFWIKQKFFPNEANKDYLDVGHSPDRMLTTQDIKNSFDNFGFQINKEIIYNSFFVHFWDREFFRILAKLSVILFRSGQAKSNQLRTTHSGSLGSTRNIYGKYIVPILEILSFPDVILSKLKIGNTAFYLTTKQASHTNYYRNNQSYAQFLSSSKPEHFIIYTQEVLQRLNVKDNFLDVGCGSGVVVDYFNHQGLKATGTDVSGPNIAYAKTHYLGNFSLYDGIKLPYQSNKFAAAGCFDVLEHVENPIGFLNESLRVVKPGGYFTICSPNFLSITSSYHYRTKGLVRKIKNIIIILGKLINYQFGSDVSFQKFAPKSNPTFSPDDDAVNLINILDVLKWGRLNNLKVITCQGAILPYYLSYTLRKVTFINLFTGGVFITFQKP